MTDSSTDQTETTFLNLTDKPNGFSEIVDLKSVCSISFREKHTLGPISFRSWMTITLDNGKIIKRYGVVSSEYMKILPIWQKARALTTHDTTQNT